MLLKLADHLDVPLRDRNNLLLAAGYAPVFRERPLADPALRPQLEAVELVLAAHNPYPALAIDRHWNMVSSNEGVRTLIAGVDQSLLTPPVNVLRLSLHPKGLAPGIANLFQWRDHLLHRVRRQVQTVPDPELIDLLKELESFPSPTSPTPMSSFEPGQPVLPLRLAFENTILNLFSTTMVFGTPLDVTLSELAIESFFPADQATATLLKRRYAESQS